MKKRLVVLFLLVAVMAGSASAQSPVENRLKQMITVGHILEEGTRIENGNVVRYTSGVQSIKIIEEGNVYGVEIYFTGSKSNNRLVKKDLKQMRNLYKVKIKKDNSCNYVFATISRK